MKTLIRSCLVVAVLPLLLISPSRAATDSGVVDFTHLKAAANGESMQINFSGTMLKFVAGLAAEEEPEMAELISNLKSVRVQVINLDKSNRAENIAQIDSARRQMDSHGWAQVVSMVQEGGACNVAVHLLQSNDESIDGLVVTVIDQEKMVAVINITGNIRADMIAAVVEKFSMEASVGDETQEDNGSLESSAMQEDDEALEDSESL